MYRILPSLLLCLLSTAHLRAQDQEVTVSTGPSYVNESFYALDKDSTWSAQLKNWHLAFGTSFAASIQINSGLGLKLYKVTNADQSEFATLDTTGMMASYPELHNSTTSWDEGAFNSIADTSNSLDLGWGTYNMITHVVTGDSLFLLAIPDTAANAQPGEMLYKKLYIDKLEGGKFIFRHANLDNSDDYVDTLDKADFRHSNGQRVKNFGYFNLFTRQPVDREPYSDQWDLQFGKYAAMVAPGSYYTVSGVRANRGLRIAEVADIDTSAIATLEDTSKASFSTDIDVIGHDWKSFNMSTYDIEDSLTYIVATDSGDYYSLVFTGFGGSANGDYTFKKEFLGQVTDLEVEQREAAESGIRLFPNPAVQSTNLVLENLSRGEAQLRVYSLEGKMIEQRVLPVGGDFAAYKLNLSLYEAGLYVLQVDQNQQSWSEKLIVK